MPQSACITAEADGRTRTGDILFTREVLYQLSYVGDAGTSVAPAALDSVWTGRARSGWRVRYERGCWGSPFGAGPRGLVPC